MVLPPKHLRNDWPVLTLGDSDDEGNAAARAAEALQRSRSTPIFSKFWTEPLYYMHFDSTG